MTSPTLSIVVTSYSMDRFKDVCELLDSIKVQTFESENEPFTIETIFIAERSIELYDKLKVYGDQIGLSYFRVQYSSEKLGLAGARNLGAKKATGDIIAFIDDDVILFPDWAQQMVKSYGYGSPIGVTGAAFPRWQDKKLDWLPKNFYWLISCTDWIGWDKVTEARTLWGMNMSLHKEAFRKASFIQSVGHRDLFLGYREPPIPEDMEFSLRIKRATGRKLLFNPGVRVWHKVYSYRLNIRFVASRSRHIGLSRRLLRATSLKEQSNLLLESKVVMGIGKIYLGLPVDLFKNPLIAWKKFVMTSTIVLFAGFGYIFPGKALKDARSIEASLH
jgi:glucosyl-dolichyl phosphate glucuronosyltransferase